MEIGLSQGVTDQLKFIIEAGASLKKWRKLASKSKDRFNRLKELVTTEKDYFNDLNTIKNCIRQPLLQQKIISEQQARSMFPNLEGMIILSDQIYGELVEVLKRWNRKDTLLGTVMIKFSQFLMIYSDFFKNLIKTQQLLKDLLSRSEKAKAIEKQLSTPNRIITFQDLISKPFQRPLKYHLLLRDYWSKTDPSHPDYQNLRNAIDLYHKVNEKNNESIENKEREQTLFTINNKFGNIIEGETKYYVGQYDAVCLETPVTIYLLSNLVLLAYKKTPDKEFLRMSFDKYSHVETAGDSEVLKNRLYFYGKKQCIHLTFMEKLRRDDFYHILKKMITEININEEVRETAINERLSSRRSTLKRKFSFTNLDPQLLRPINAKIIGLECRQLAPNDLRNYYAIEFYPTPASFNNNYTPHHISLVNEETITKLEKLINRLYPNELKCMPIFSAPKSIINELEYRKNESKRLEIRTMFIQLFLNSLFRCEQIVKRIDYVLYSLRLSDPIWNYLKIKEQENCNCKVCMKWPEIKTTEEYEKEALQRQEWKGPDIGTRRKTQYCQIRTITSHQQLSYIFPELLARKTSEEKIAWCKTKLGKINHTLTNVKPQSCLAKPITIKVSIRGFPNVRDYSITVNREDRVKKIISILSNKAEINFQDYALLAQIRNKFIIMEEDEPISNAFIPQQEEGFLDRISNFFSKKQEVVVKFTLQKYLVIYCQQDYMNVVDKHRKIKVNLEIESIMGRLYQNLMIVGEEDLLEFYALFMCKKYYSQYKSFTAENVAIKARNRAEFYFPSRLHNESYLCRLYQRIKKIANDPSIKNDYDIAVKIIHKASSRPGWSCIMLNCNMETGLNEPLKVSIGCDLRGVRVREHGKINMLLEFNHEDDTWQFHTSGSSLVIVAENQKEYQFSNRQIWKIGQQIQFYKLYLKSFGAN